MQRALIVKLGAIGDVIMTVPAVHALHLQGYRIDWVCGLAVADLLRCYSWINVIPADDRAVLKGSLTERLRAITSVWKQLIGVRYDLSATLYYDARWRIFALPARAGKSLTLSHTDRTRRILPTRSYVNEFARILLDLPDGYRDVSLLPQRPDNLPPSVLPPSTTSRIAMVPAGASNMVRQQTLRRWPADRYAEIARTLLDRGDEVVLLGGPTDAWVREHFQSLAGHPRLVDLIGATTLPQLISTADTCSLVLSHDTGPLHLAGLSTAPILALFGPTDPANFLPRRACVRVLWGGEDLACRPCYDGRDFAPCNHNGCMQSITTGTVLRTLDEMITNPDRPYFEAIR